MSAAQAFLTQLSANALRNKCSEFETLKNDNCLQITRPLSMTTLLIILNKILVSTEALNCNFQSDTVNYRSCSKFLWTSQLYTALGGTSHDRLCYLGKEQHWHQLLKEKVIFAAMALIVSLWSALSDCDERFASNSINQKQQWSWNS